MERQDKEKEFFDGIKKLDNHFKVKYNLSQPLTNYFEYRKHEGIPVYFKGEMRLDEEIREAITYLQAKTIGI